MSIVAKILKEGSGNVVTLYRGQEEIHQTLPSLVFLSTSKGFASDYGKVTAYQVDLGKIFDSVELKHIKLLYNAGFKLTDDWLTDEDEIDGYENGEYVSAVKFINSPYTSDTWNPIENTDGVIDWIFSNGFDSIAIYEGGTENYLVPRKRIVGNI